MPKPETELTPKQKAFSDAKVKLEAAQKADEAKSSAATVAAVKAAEEVYRSTNAAVKRENFVRVAGSRAKKVNIALRNLGNVNNLRTYSYTEADVAVAEKAITSNAAKAIAAMRAGLQTSAAAPKEQEENLFA